MKICPFVSHMIGEGGTNVLQIDSPAGTKTEDAASNEDVVILGYDDGESVGVKTKPSKTKKTDADFPSHLECLKETCRFYQKPGGTCTFDTILKTVSEQAKKASPKKTAKDPAEKAAEKVTKELDKFWKFQTKSVSELIASIGDTEKKQEKSFSEFKKNLDLSIDRIGSHTGSADLDGIKSEVGKLQEAIESREEGIESFSTTISELAMNIDDTLSSLKARHESLTNRFDQFEVSIKSHDDDLKRLSSAPGLSDIEKKHQASLERIERIIEENSHAPNDGFVDEIKSMAGRFEELLEANRKIEEQLRDWRSDIESRVDSIRDNQQSWRKHIDDVVEKQDEIIASVQAEKKRFEDESARLKQKEARKLNNLGVTSFHNGQLEMARDQFLDAVALDSDFAECYNNLGLVYTELHKEQEATDAFRRAIEINPDLPAAYNNLGYVFYKKGEYGQAIEMYNEALGRSTDSSSAYTNLGNAYYKQGNHADARKSWEKALELDPENEKASRNLKRLDEE